MNFRILGVPADDFARLFELSDDDLAKMGGVRRTADGNYLAGSASQTRSRATSCC
jgi:hypothetical protein